MIHEKFLNFQVDILLLSELIQLKLENTFVQNQIPGQLFSEDLTDYLCRYCVPLL
jgi:hypothetical protein